jgi:hypothetical protein
MFSHQVREGDERVRIRHFGRSFSLDVRLDPLDPRHGPFSWSLRIPPGFDDYEDEEGWTAVVHRGCVLKLRVRRLSPAEAIRRGVGEFPFVEVVAPRSWVVTVEPLPASAAVIP